MDELAIWVAELRNPHKIGLHGAIAILVVFSFYLTCTSKNNKSMLDRLIRTLTILITSALSLLLAGLSLAGILLNILLPINT